jgi:sugar lactone lactonase YvrE
MDAASLFAQPTISIQPVNQYATNGGGATFSVTASGNGLLTYQWQFNGTNLPASIITTVAGGGFGNNGPAINGIVNYPLGVVMDSNGNLFIATYSDNRVHKVDTNGIITIFAGNGTSGDSGDGGPALYAAFRNPAGVALDNSGDLFLTDSYYNRVRKISTNGIITTVAGGGVSLGDGGAGTNAALYLGKPAGIAVDTAGNLFIADDGNNRIRMVNTNGIISTVAGNGASGYFGDGYAATNAELKGPQAVAVDAMGNLFIADTQNSRIRKVDTNGIITSVAGKGYLLYYGDGGAATNAGFAPFGVAVDALGEFFIADQNNNRIRKVDTNGIITTIAGKGTIGYSGDGGNATNAALNHPASVFVDATGNLLIADSSNDAIRKVGTNGIITTVAGTGSTSFGGDGGSATNAALINPYDVAINTAGELFIADINNSRIRKVDTNGVITTFAGGGSALGDGSQATNSTLNEPAGVAVDPTGSVLVADAGDYRIRKVNPNGIINTVAGNGSAGSSGDGGAATNAALSLAFAAVSDAIGNLLFSDTENDDVRRVDTNGIITRVAGGGNSGFLFAGDGGPATNAKLYFPVGLVVDAIGNILIADRDNNRIRKVDTNGIISTIAGSGTQGYSGDNGYATNAALNWPSGLALDAVGNILIGDSGNNLIRKVNANGIIMTVAGGGKSLGDYGDPTNAALAYPVGLAMDVVGNYYIADSSNSRVRKVSAFGNLSMLVLNNITTNSAGSYQVIVTDTSGSVTSLVSTLTLIQSWPAFVGKLLNSDGSLTLNMFSPAGISSRLWFTTNLTSPVVWEPLSTNFTGGSWQFTDTNAIINLFLFYRLSSP